MSKDYVSELIGMLKYVGVIVGLGILIVVTYSVGVSTDQYVPGAGGFAATIIGGFFLVIILYRRMSCSRRVLT